ncbi:MAG: hypothetical protein V3T77_03370, partial [Planctomycetota bacterium]
MGVTLRYCDLCGLKLGPEELRDPGILKIQNKIFCSTCKPKVVTKIQQQRAKKKAAAEAQAEAGPSGKAPVPRRAPGKAPQRAARAPLSAPSRTRGRAPVRKKRRDIAGRPVARRPLQHPVEGRGEARTRKKFPIQEAPQEEGEGFHIERRSNALLYSILSLVGVAAVIGFYVLLKPAPPPPEPKPVAKKEAPTKNRKEQESERSLSEAIEFFEKNPEKFEEARERFAFIARFYVGMPASKQAVERAAEVLEACRTKVKVTWASLKLTTENLMKNGEFESAYEQVREVPDYFEGYGGKDFHMEIKNLQSFAEVQKEANRRLQELRGKALSYAKQKNTVIAIEVLKA